MKRILLPLILLVFILIPAVASAADSISGLEAVVEADNIYYDGTEKCPAVHIEGLEEGVDFTLEYEDNTEIGTAKVKITGKGDYYGTVTRTFDIEKAKISISGINRNINKAASAESLTDKVRLENCFSDLLILQRYDRSKDEWIDVEGYAVSEPDEEVIINYPSYWKKHAVTKWRLLSPETEMTSEYVSDIITVTARNIKKASFSSKAVCIMDAETGSVIYGRNYKTRRSNASTTKIMTALLVMENGNMKDKVKISKKASKTPYRNLWMNPGDRYYVKSLFRAMMISSSNDASTALAEYMSGSVSKFSKKMNERAESIGCTGTHFVNPHGLPSDSHKSTARDICLMQRECIKHDFYLDTIKKSTYSFKNVKGTRGHKVYSTDALLGTSGFLGGKTGWTEAAGNCFCGVYEYKGRKYIFCTLGCYSGRSTMWSDSKACMKYIRDTY